MHLKLFSDKEHIYRKSKIEQTSVSYNKIILKNSLILYVRLFITSIIGLVSVRFILTALGASDYGLYSVIGGIVFMMAFLNNVMISSTYRFVAYELGTGNTDGVNKVFNISLVFHIILAVLTGLLAETVGIFYIKKYLNIPTDKLIDALFVFRMSIIATILSIFSIPYQGLITAKEKFTIIATMEVIRSILGLCVVLFLFYYSGNKLRLYAFLITIISVIPPAIYYLYCKWNYRKLVKWQFQRDKKKYNEIIGFSGWVLLGASANAAETKISEIIINLFFGTLINAGFAISSNINNVIKNFAESLNKAVIPQITKSYSSGNPSRTIDLVIFSSKYSFFLMLLTAAPLLLETKYVLELWLKEVPPNTVIFVQLMIINTMIEVMNAGVPAAVHATGKIKHYQIVLGTIKLLASPAAYFLLKTGHESYTIIIAFTVSAVINLVVQQIILKKLIQFNIKEFIMRAYVKMLYVLFPITSLFFIQHMFKPGIYRFVGFSAVSVLFTIVMVYAVGISNSERDSVRYFITNKFIKK